MLNSPDIQPLLFERALALGPKINEQFSICLCQTLLNFSRVISRNEPSGLHCIMFFA